MPVGQPTTGSTRASERRIPNSNSVRGGSGGYNNRKAATKTTTTKNVSEENVNFQKEGTARRISEEEEEEEMRGGRRRGGGAAAVAPPRCIGVVVEEGQVQLERGSQPQYPEWPSRPVPVPQAQDVSEREEEKREAPPASDQDTLLKDSSASKNNISLTLTLEGNNNNNDEDVFERDENNKERGGKENITILLLDGSGGEGEYDTEKKKYSSNDNNDDIGGFLSESGNQKDRQEGSSTPVPLTPQEASASLFPPHTPLTLLEPQQLGKSAFLATSRAEKTEAARRKGKGGKLTGAAKLEMLLGKTWEDRRKVNGPVSSLPALKPLQIENYPSTNAVPAATSIAKEGGGGLGMSSSQRPWTENDKLISECILRDASMINYEEHLPFLEREAKRRKQQNKQNNKNNTGATSTNFVDSDMDGEEEDPVLVANRALTYQLEFRTTEVRKYLAELVKRPTVPPTDGDEGRMLPDFKKIELSLEARRFMGERWLEKIVFALSVQKFEKEMGFIQGNIRLKEILSPYVFRKTQAWRAQAKRQVLTHERFASNKLNRPLPQFLQKNCDFFKDWPVEGIETILREMTPLSFSKGEYVLHSGDVGREMFLIANGLVDIVAIDKRNSAKPKSKGVSNGQIVATLHQGDIFGEGGLLTNEPRSASVYCNTDVDVWVIPHRVYQMASASCSSLLRDRFQRLSDDRRKSNMANVFRLHPDNLRNVEAYLNWHAAGLDGLCQAYRPEVVRKESVLFSIGDEDFASFFVLTGKVVLLSKEQEVLQTIGPGEVFGVEEAIFAEPRTCTAKCLTPCELFILDRTDFIQIAQDYPHCIMESHLTLNARRAAIFAQSRKKAILKDSRFTSDEPLCYLEDHTLNYLIPQTVLCNQWKFSSKPMLYSAGDSLFRDMDTCSHIVIVLTGTLHIRHGPEGPTAYNDQIIVKDQPNGGVVFGGVEIAMKRKCFLSSVRCTSPCYAFLVNRRSLEEELAVGYPLVWSSVLSGSTTEIVSDLFKKNRLRRLEMEVTPPKDAGNVRITVRHRAAAAAAAAAKLATVDQNPLDDL